MFTDLDEKKAALATLLELLVSLDEKAEGEEDPAERAQLYARRNRILLRAWMLAGTCGYPTGVGVDMECDWPVLYMELPTGQVSYHIPPHSAPWDGHTKETANERIARFVDKIRKENLARTAYPS